MKAAAPLHRPEASPAKPGSAPSVDRSSTAAPAGVPLFLQAKLVSGVPALQLAPDPDAEPEVHDEAPTSETRPAGAPPGESEAGESEPGGARPSGAAHDAEKKATEAPSEEKAAPGEGGTTEGGEGSGDGGGDEGGGDEGGGEEEGAPGGAVAVQLACACGGGCDRCGAARDAADETLRVQGAGGRSRGSWPSPSQVTAQLGGGSPLPPHLATRFSDAFGYDFSQVRIHESTTVATRLGAHAFTVGNDVGFAPGTYRPGTPEGDRLIAHELTHVVQQSGGKGRLQAKGASYDALEREADHTADAVTTGRRVENVSPVAGKPVQKGIIGRIASAAAGWVADRFWDAVRELFPSLEPYLRNPGKIWTDIVSAIGDGLGSLFGRLLGPLRELDPIGAVRETLGPLFRGVQAMLTTGDCAPLFKAIGDMASKLRRLAAPALRLAGRVFDAIKNLIQGAKDRIFTPAWELLQQVGGRAFEAISYIGTKLGELVARVRGWGERAWNWLKGLLGLDSGGGGSGESTWAWIKRKASEAWEKAKATVAPWIGPLTTAATVLLALSPLGPLVIAIKFGPRIVRYLTQLWQQLRVADRIAGARRRIASMFPPILAFLRSVGIQLAGVADSVATGLDTAANVLLPLVGALTRAPLMGLVADAVRWVANKIRQGAQWFRSEVLSGFQRTQHFLHAAAEFGERVLNIALKLIMIAGNPLMLPLMLASELWQRLPGCFKLPILNWLLDLLLAVLRRLPMSAVLGPLGEIFKHGIIGFLERVRGTDQSDEKVRVSDRIARLLQGSIQFVGGLVEGLLTGVWEGLAMPFELVYQLFTVIPAVADFIERLPERIASVLRGIGAQISEAARWVADNFWPTLRGLFSGPGGGFLATLRNIWGGIASAAESVGSSVAGALIGFIMLSDAALGEKLGWVAGTVLFEVALGYLTGGASVLLRSASAPLRVLGRLLRVVVRAHEIMNEVFGALFKMLGPVFQAFERFAARFPALGALKERIFGLMERISALAERATVAGENFAGRFAGEEARAAAALARQGETGAARVAEQAAEGSTARGAQAPAARAPETTARAPEAPAARAPEAPAAREAPPAAGETPRPAGEAHPAEHPSASAETATERETAETAARESRALTEEQLQNELRYIEENPELLQGTPPKRTAQIEGHTWRENPNGAWCRYSNNPVCTLKSKSGTTAPTEAAPAPSASEPKPYGPPRHPSGLRREEFIAQYQADFPHTGYSPEELGQFWDDGRYILNEQTGRLNNLEAGKYGAPSERARYVEDAAGNPAVERIPEKQLPPDVSSRAEALASERQRLLSEAKVAEDAGNQAVANARRAEARAASKELGDQAGREVAKKFEKEGYTEVLRGDGARTFDRVLVKPPPPAPAEHVIVLEEKGATSGLGTRYGVDGKIRVEQGSKAYVEAVANDLADLELQDTIKTALQTKQIKYLEVRRPVTDAGELLPIEVKEFGL